MKTDKLRILEWIIILVIVLAQIFLVYKMAESNKSAAEAMRVLAETSEARTREMIYSSELRTAELVKSLAPADGVDGKNGKDGRDGKDGKDGVDGRDGADGTDGAVGPAGPQGIPGKTIVQYCNNGVWFESLDGGMNYTIKRTPSGEISKCIKEKE